MTDFDFDDDDNDFDYERLFREMDPQVFADGVRARFKHTDPGAAAVSVRVCLEAYPRKPPIVGPGDYVKTRDGVLVCLIGRDPASHESWAGRKVTPSHRPGPIIVIPYENIWTKEPVDTPTMHRWQARARGEV